MGDVSMRKMKGSAFDAFAVIAVGLIMFTLPTVYEQGINDFGLAATEGVGLTTEFPPWENRTSEETDIAYVNDSIQIVDGSSSASYQTLELTNEPDEYRLIQVSYNTSQPDPDNSIQLTLSAYDTGETQDQWETQTFTLENGSQTIDFEERLTGEKLRIGVDMSRQNSNDPSPVFNSMDVSVKTIDESEISGMWQKMLMLVFIGFSLVLSVLLLAE